MQFAALHPALAGLGFTPYFHQQFLVLVADTPAFSDWLPERVVAEWGSEYQLLGSAGVRRAVLSGRLRHELADDARPCVGDFVLATPGTGADLARIEHRFERANVFRRKSAGVTARAQPIAANIDLALVVSAFSEPDADSDAARRGVNVRRIERYLRAVAEAPAEAVVVLNKADLCADAEEQAAELGAQLGGVEVYLVSARSELGVPRLAERLGSGVTAVLVGPSGVGKSSLTNRLLESDVQRVNDIREADARGRHTTTHRQIFTLPSGGLLVDTPGMRELGLHTDSAVDPGHTGFEEIDSLAGDCRFRDCTHVDEPGCAVLAAVNAGEIERERLDHAHKLQQELAFQAARSDARKRSEARRQYRALSVASRARQREKGRG
ncbi:MAG TPA: ribosome small subunit-dependent GTPase A [Polyangiaceae bacterium]|jgi:ribosome biogenesis GTPase|nr:ribosome small subunit-dependent GTPase A [Polyangiaceae bacterium]